MKTLKKGIALLLGIMLCISLLPAPVYAVSDDTEAAVISEQPEEQAAELMETSSGSCGDNLTWTMDTDAGELIISGTGDMDNWTCYDDAIGPEGRPWDGDIFGENIDSIKTVVINDGVTSIGDGAFWGFSALTDVTIPDSVVSIGAFTFRYCTSLTDITLPNGVTSIGRNTFDGCTALTNFTIPSSVTIIGAAAFSGCRSLTDITIPTGVSIIDDECFCNCDALANVTLPDTVTHIGYRAFYNCDALTDISLPNGVTSIENEAFLSCETLREILIPSQVTSMGYGVFAHCSALEAILVDENNTAFESVDGVLYTLGEERVIYPAYADQGDLFFGSDFIRNELVQYPAAKEDSAYEVLTGVTMIRAEAFAYVNNLTQVTLPESLERIGEYAFYNCKGLLQFTVPSRVTEIGRQAFDHCESMTSMIILGDVRTLINATFSGCLSLTEVNLPGTLTEIGLSSFDFCDALETVYFAGSQSEWDAITVGNSNTPLDSASIVFNRVHGSCGEELVWDLDTASGELLISGTGSMDDYDNYSLPPWYGLLSQIRSVTVADDITEIGTYAFTCSKARTISLPASVTNIGYRALALCPELTAVYVDDGNPAYSTDQNVLLSYDGSELICYPPNKTGTNYRVPDGVVTIGDAAFGASVNLRSLELPTSVERIESNAFWLCRALKSVSLPDSLTEIGDGAFQSCFALESIEIPAGVTDIPFCAFCCCDSLKSIEIPDGVTTIGSYVFYDCYSLETVSVPGSVTSMGENVFEACPNLSDIYYDGTAEEWAALAINASAEGASLHSTEQYDVDLTAEITTTDVPGGVLVTMSSPGGQIYFTLDGTAPSESSIPYQTGFVLSRADEYSITAAAIDPQTGTYGDRTAVYILLKQSGAPEIWEENGEVLMRSNGGEIYYSFDLTNEPISAGDRYVQPIPLTETKLIRAQTVESGKAPSEITSKTFYVTSEETGQAWKYSYPDDSYSFPNDEESFGYPKGFASYRIPKERYLEMFGFGIGSGLFEDFDGKWKGSCFGMASTSLLFCSGLLNLHDYSISAEIVKELPAPLSPDSELTKLIERYQIAQFLEQVGLERDDLSVGGNMVICSSNEDGSIEAAEGLLDAVRSACSGGEPIILILWGPAGSMHAVVPYEIEEGKIKVYDCDNPIEENIVSYHQNSDQTYQFSYDIYNLAISYNKLSTLLECLEGIQTETGRLQESAAARMMVSLNTKSFVILDEEGNEVRDYLTIGAVDNSTQSDGTSLYLEPGKYTVRNTDGELEELRVSAATKNEYDTVVTAPGAEIEIGTAYGFLSLAVRNGEAVEIRFRTKNAAGLDNEFELTADYARVSACTELTTLLETSADAAKRNGEALALTKKQDSNELFESVIRQRRSETVPESLKQIDGIGLSTDVGELLEQDFTLTAKVTGAGERARVFAVSYDADGRMTDIRGWETQAGKTKYPFTIAGGTAEVKLFVLDLTSGEPLTESLTLRQG